MSVLSIRARRRYAVRIPVKLQRAQSSNASGLLIELSQEGARISNLGQGKYEVGDAVTLVTTCGKRLAAKIRWSHDGIAGVRLDQPLHLPQLSELINAHRPGQSGDGLRYGT